MVQANILAKTLRAAIIFCIFGSTTTLAASNHDTSIHATAEPEDGISYWMDTTFPYKKVHVLRIDLTHPNIMLRSSKSSERGLTPSEFASKTDAIAVINGDFFDAAQKTIGLAIGQGEVWPGSADTKEWSFLACDSRNDCLIDPYNTVSSAKTNWTSVVGGWQILLDPNFEWTAQNDTQCGAFCTTEHPRTALGLSSDRKLMWWVVVEGRQAQLSGLSLSHLTRIFRKLGAEWALNLDGGGSSGLILDGRRITGRPANEPQERRVANCLAIVRRP